MLFIIPWETCVYSTNWCLKNQRSNIRHAKIQHKSGKIEVNSKITFLDPFFSYIPLSEIRNQLRAKKHKFYSIITCCCVFWIPFFWRIGWLWWNLEYFQRKSWCKSIFQATILKQNDNGYLICLVPWLSENDWKKWMKLERTLFFIEYWNKSHQFIIIAFTH